MLMRENILLTHISESWLGEATVLAASLVSKTIGNITFAPDLLINQSLGQGTVFNRELLESKRAEKAKSLDWTLFMPDSLIDALSTAKFGRKLFNVVHNSWAYQFCPTRDLFVNLSGWAGTDFVASRDQKGFGGVSRQLHNILRREIYQPLKINIPAYDSRDEYSQYLDALFSVAFVQYMNWANGLAHTYENLLQCYLLVNGYRNNYVVRVNTWRSVDEPVMTFKPNPNRQGSRIMGIGTNMVTKNFSWNELMHSNTAKAYKINNTATGKERENLIELANLLQVIRDWHGRPMVINSAYRSPETNRKVGGVSNSAHMHGYAGDIKFAGVPVGASNMLAFARKIGSYLKSQGVKFDQIISYDDFIHVGVRRPGGAQRCEVFHTNRYQSTVRRYK